MDAKTTWAIDPSHSEITFKIKHMMISTVSGHFGKFDAYIEAANDDFKDATASVDIQIDSINTNDKNRDAHLQSEEFFDAAKFPKMTFKSTSFDGKKLTGDLTIKGTTKEVALDVDFNGTATDPYGQTKAGFEITGEISRKAFGLTWNAVTEAGSVVVSDNVKIIIDAQFTKK